MVRKSKASETMTQQIAEALETPVNMEWSVIAEKLNLPVPDLQERVAAKLDDATVFAWDNLPIEHESVVEAIQRDLEVEASVRRITPQAEAQLPPVVEPPLLQEPEAPKVKQSKRKSSALTQKKSEAIAQGRAASKQTNQGVKQVLAKLQAQEGIKDAANAGTTYLQAFQATLNQVKGEGLTVLAAEMIQSLTAESDFTPDEILADLGVSLSTETQQALLEKLTPVLGKSEIATQEILSTAWGNGINLDLELSKLDNLMSFEN